MKFILFLLTLYSANLIADEYDQLSVNITQEKEENMANKYRMNVSSKSFCGLAANYDHFLKVAEEYCKKNHALLQATLLP